MDDREFIELVESLRAAQQRFFRTRATTALDQARILERQVDRELRARRYQRSPDDYPTRDQECPS